MSALEAHMPYYAHRDKVFLDGTTPVTVEFNTVDVAGGDIRVVVRDATGESMKVERERISRTRIDPRPAEITDEQVAAAWMAWNGVANSGKGSGFDAIRAALEAARDAS